MKIVVALGGNALGNSPKEQLDLVKKTAKNIVDLVSEGHDVIISHGNGPQVGMINLAMEAATVHENAPEMPFAECGAMSQGYIGYHLQQALEKELAVRKVKKRCITVVTQVMVDAKDPAFQNPTKPIGSFYTKEQADKIKKEKGYVMKEDAGRGFRRVVASPKPIRIVERDSINYMVHNGIMVIACGGGGIPVIKEGYGYKGVDAVIDKDRTSAKLAADVEADMLIILTAVDTVITGFGTDHEKQIRNMTVKEAKELMAAHEFKEGSMLPKVEACIEYVENSNGKALITSLERAKEALSGKTGTLITKK